MLEGFIITSLVKQTENQKEYMEYAGVLEDGRSFLWRQSPAYCFAFVKPETDLSGIKVKKTIQNKFKTLQDEAVHLVYFASQADLKEAQRNVPEESQYEFDVDPALRFLAERKIKAKVCFESEPAEEDGQVVCFHNPKVKPGKKAISVRTMSFDIETGVSDGLLYSIATHTSDKNSNKVFMLADFEKTNQTEAGTEVHYLNSEKKLIEAFIQEVIDSDPQVFIGWNVLNFDFKYLLEKAASFDLHFNIGVGGVEIEHFFGKNKKDLFMKIPGRTVIDGMFLMRMMGVKLPNYSLDTAGNVLLGEGKLITAQAHDKVAEIEDYFKNNKPLLADYNMKDTVLVDRIFKHLNGVDYQVNKAILSGVPLDKVSSNLDLSEIVYLPELHRKGYIGPTKSNKQLAAQQSSQVTHSMSGLYENIHHLRFEHLAGSMIQFFFIDPLGRQLAEKMEKQALPTPKGFSFHRKEHVLPGIFARFHRLRQLAHSQGKKSAQMAVDWVEENYINQLFDSNNRFSSLAIQSSIQNNVVFLLEELKKALSESGDRFIYGDAHDLIIQSEKKTEELQGQVHASLKKILAEVTPVTLLPEIKTEAFYSNAFLLIDSHKKSPIRFAGLSQEQQVSLHALKLTGNDTTLLAKEFQEGLLKTLLKRQNPVEYLRVFKTALYQNEKDDLVYYYKRIQRGSDPTAENASPQSIAGHKLAPPLTAGWVHYAMTVDGPEPKDHLKSQVDYDHYLESQLKPVAQIFLEHTAYRESIEELNPGEPQLSLFGV